MRTRIVTALLLAAVLGGVLLYGPPLAVRALFGLLVVAGAWEWGAFVGARGRTGRLVYALLVAALAVAARACFADSAGFGTLMGIAVIWWFIALAWLAFAPQVVNHWSAAFAGIMALAPTWVALTRIAEYWPRGTQWALFIVIIAYAADTGAFFAGRAFGRVKLAPVVSPGKTWEGVIGGIVLAGIVAAGASQWFGLPVGSFVPLCLVAAAFSVVGDLNESMLKRASGLKDSGRVFPGHGGVLDRIDSVMAATPVMSVGLLWLGVGA
jgi:phosphatidate cytidylyltransferase